MISRRTLLLSAPVTLVAVNLVPAAQAANFPDLQPATPFYGYMTWAAEQGYIDAYPDGTFRPYATVTRQEIAAIFYKFYGKPEYTPPAKSYLKDISPTHKYYKEISWAVTMDVFTGKEDGTLGPEEPVTKGEVAYYFYALAGEPYYIAPGISFFTDLNYETPYYKEIHFLADSKIATGWSDGTYRPFSNLQRTTLSCFMYKFMKRYR